MIYEVIVWVDDDRYDEWLRWMEENHIPDVMNTRCFSSYNLNRLAQRDANGRRATQVIYVLQNATSWHTYFESHAPRLQAKHLEKFHGATHAERALISNGSRQPL